METEVTRAIPPPVIENIPGRLAERPQWVTWRAVEREGKLTKVPLTPGTERRASTTDLLTWATFEEALAAYEAGEPPCHGIGFVFCSADPFVGIDLDGCVRQETGELAAWARKMVDDFAKASYVEISPSGTGIHIVTEGVQVEGVRRGPVEIYGQSRFFTITGKLLA